MKAEKDTTIRNKDFFSPAAPFFKNYILSAYMRKGAAE
jgi:hypothetical protein